MSEQQPLQAMFRFFRTEEEIKEPITELILPAPLFALHLEYDGHYFEYEGATPNGAPAGYTNKIIASWDFREIFPKSLHPHSAPGEHPAKCIVCDAPFPLHTIRCGTAA